MRRSFVRSSETVTGTKRRGLFWVFLKGTLLQNEGVLLLFFFGLYQWFGFGARAHRFFFLISVFSSHTRRKNRGKKARKRKVRKKRKQKEDKVSICRIFVFVFVNNPAVNSSNATKKMRVFYEIYVKTCAILAHVR